MTSLLSERIKETIKNQSESAWFPALTNDLVEIGRQQLFESIGISYTDYGTTRVMAKSASAPCNIAGHLFTSLSNEQPGKGIKVEILDRSFAHRYEEVGIRFYTAEEIASLNLLGHLKDTFSILKTVPTLFESVTSLVRSIHLIKPKDDDYDVSFSEPYIPFSIFISIPQDNSAINVLRVAEAAVHEAMHLQLTLVEELVPLLIKTPKKIFSPWRGEYRTLQGVLHALYVFKVIDRFLESLLSIGNYSGNELEYIQMRRKEIILQINKIRSFRDCSELTMIGARFVKKLVQN